MNQKTWPYGTTRQATIIKIFPKTGTKILILTDDQGEGHLITSTDTPNAKTGDHGTITFTKGGPTGGYWKYEPNP